MKTIIWKELRENLKWAVLALLGLAIAEVYALHQRRNYPTETLCSSNFLLVTAAGGALIGAVLGALQILPERRRDQWAALLHRPLSHRAIFSGKVGAGLVLYFLATVPPLLISIVYAVTPGNFGAPVVLPAMLLPAASDLVFGLAFYFAALLAALYPGRWFGVRGVFLLSLLPLAFFHLVADWMFLGPIVASLILMTVACGAMTTTGPLRNYPKLARGGVVFLVLVGTQVIVAVVILGLALLPAAHQPRSTDMFYRGIEMTREGKPLVRNGGMLDPLKRYTELDGTPMTDERYVGNNASRMFCSFERLTWKFSRDSSVREADAAANPRDGANFLSFVNASSMPGRESWYYLVRSNQFVAYDRLGRRRVGFLDKGGFRVIPGAPQPFDGDLERVFSNAGPDLFWSTGSIYRVDFSGRSVTPIFAAQPDRIHGVAELRPEQNKRLSIAVALEKEIALLDPRGAPLLTIPYGHDPSLWPSLSIATVPAGDRLFVKYGLPYSSELQNSASDRNRTFVDEVDLQGKVVHTTSIVSRPLRTPPRGWLLNTTALCLPLAAPAVYDLRSWLSPSRESDLNSFRWQFLAEAVPLPWLATLGGVCAILAIGAYSWGRSAGLPAKSCRRWALFVFCFGVPGLITFRLAANWPARVRCPSCSRKRSVETEECPACRQPWPAPTRNGTEIFELTADTSL